MGKTTRKTEKRGADGRIPILPIRINQELRSRIAACAAAEGVTVSEWMRHQAEIGCRKIERMSRGGQKREQ